MDFKRGGCDFCEDCLNVCETHALKKFPTTTITKQREEHSESIAENDSDAFLPPWHIKANIDLKNCLSMNGTICRSCGEACDDEAIKFNLKLGGIAEPILNQENCTGCGACFSVCPVQVIELKTLVINRTTEKQAEQASA